jgi:hypothetical protein
VFVLMATILAALQASGAIPANLVPPIVWLLLRIAGLLIAGFFTAMALAASALVVRAYLRRARGRHRRIRVSLAGISVCSLTSLAGALAGRGGFALLQESDAHVAGHSGHDTPSWAKVKEAAGFVVAGVRYRGQDWADAAWRPVDAALRSRFLSGLFVAVPTIVVAFEVLTHKGAMTVLTSWGSIFCVGTGLAASIKGGRKYRDVQPPEPKARQAKE